MEQISVSNWAELDQKIIDLEAQRDERAADGQMGVSRLLFRGQANADWGLSTTLERAFGRDVSLEEYYRFALAAQPRIESFTEQRWEIPSYDAYRKWLTEQRNPFIGDLPGYEYFAYLRHHGFPSPLLDWSASPYVATFFAFRQPPHGSETAAIFVYLERPTGGKAATGGDPIIHSRGPYVRTHQRHFFQQSQYTICAVDRNGTHYYVSHDSVIAQNNQHQDLLWKLCIPISERRIVLKNLARMNISAFSLFGSEESLLESIATEEMLLNDK